VCQLQEKALWAQIYTASMLVTMFGSVHIGSRAGSLLCNLVYPVVIRVKALRTQI
jgi:hypothetical protein